MSTGRSTEASPTSHIGISVEFHLREWRLGYSCESYDFIMDSVAPAVPWESQDTLGVGSLGAFILLLAILIGRGAIDIAESYTVLLISWVSMRSQHVSDIRSQRRNAFLTWQFCHYLMSETRFWPEIAGFWSEYYLWYEIRNVFLRWYYWWYEVRNAFLCWDIRSEMSTNILLCNVERNGCQYLTPFNH